MKSTGKTTQGKLPPQCIEIEEAILGCLMTNPSALYEHIDFIQTEMFYKESNQLIYSAIKTLNSLNNKIDMLTVINQLKTGGTLEQAGGVYTISKLAGDAIRTTNIEEYSKILAEKWMKRELIRFCNESINEAYDETKDVFQTHEYLQSQLLNIDLSVTNTVQKLDEVAKEVYVNITKNYNGEQTGIKSGFHKFDNFGGGFQPSDLIVIAAESSQGKTSLALNMMNNSCSLAPVGIISLEMSSVQLGSRLLAIESGIEGRRIQFEQFGQTEYQILERYIGVLETRNIYIDAKCSSSFTQIKSSIRQMVVKHGVKVVFVDYLQMISLGDKTQNRAQEVSSLAFAFKNLAKSLNITIVLISTLRKVENTGSHYPTKARLKESGDIEYAADMILFVYYDAEYNPGKELNIDGNMVSNEDVAEIIVAKGRNVGTGVFYLGFDRKQTKFTNYEFKPLHF